MIHLFRPGLPLCASTSRRVSLRSFARLLTSVPGDSVIKVAKASVSPLRSEIELEEKLGIAWAKTLGISAFQHLTFAVRIIFHNLASLLLK